MIIAQDEQIQAELRSLHECWNGVVFVAGKAAKDIQYRTEGESYIRENSRELYRFFFEYSAEY